MRDKAVVDEIADRLKHPAHELSRHSHLGAAFASSARSSLRTPTPQTAATHPMLFSLVLSREWGNGSL